MNPSCLRLLFGLRLQPRVRRKRTLLAAVDGATGNPA